MLKDTKNSRNKAMFQSAPQGKQQTLSRRRKRLLRLRVSRLMSHTNRLMLPAQI
jgi:hypothetical protein